MMTKLASFLTLAALWPLALVSAAAIWLDSAGPILVNDGGLKFRTTTLAGQTTRLGRFLRKAGLDNLPQRFVA